MAGDVGGGVLDGAAAIASHADRCAGNGFQVTGDTVVVVHDHGDGDGPDRFQFLPVFIGLRAAAVVAQGLAIAV
jgi:hypothetical protein